MRPVSFLVMLTSGVLFGLGLSVSQMIRPEVVLGFLQLKDMGLLLVMGGAATVTLFTYQLVPRLLRRPVLEAVPFESKRPPLDRRTFIGAALFGVGWGLCGVCPGPAVAGIGAGEWTLAFAVAGIALGAFVQGQTARA